MKPPAISDRVFEVLSVLLDGGIHSFEEIQAAIDFEPTRNTFNQVIERLIVRGQVRRHRFSTIQTNRKGHDQTVWRPAYEITDKGRQAWAEKADFFAFLLKRFADPKRIAAAKRPAGKTDLQAAPRVIRPRQHERRPTDAEVSRVLKRAPKALRTIVQAMRAGVLSVDELIALDVEDVHFGKTTTIRLAGRRRSLEPDPAFRELVGEAVGHRTTGPLFESQRRVRWRRGTLSTVWRNACRRAGVPRDVKLLGRLSKQEKRKREGVLF
jgi:hypothetical protein